MSLVNWPFLDRFFNDRQLISVIPFMFLHRVTVGAKYGRGPRCNYATCHMCNNTDRLYQFEALSPPLEVTMGDEHAAGRGAVALNTNLKNSSLRVVQRSLGAQTCLPPS
jgi:hypothetical protein